MSNQERFPRESGFTTGAKALSIAFTVSVVALLVTRTPLHLPEAAALPPPAVVEQTVGEAGTHGLALSAQQYEDAVRAAKQDDSPAPTF